jgi:hypothetical protein
VAKEMLAWEPLYWIVDQTSCILFSCLHQQLLPAQGLKHKQSPNWRALNHDHGLNIISQAINETHSKVQGIMWIHKLLAGQPT